MARPGQKCCLIIHNHFDVCWIYSTAGSIWRCLPLPEHGPGFKPRSFDLYTDRSTSFTSLHPELPTVSYFKLIYISILSEIICIQSTFIFIYIITPEPWTFCFIIRPLCIFVTLWPKSIFNSSLFEKGAACQNWMRKQCDSERRFPKLSEAFADWIPIVLSVKVELARTHRPPLPL